MIRASVRPPSVACSRSTRSLSARLGSLRLVMPIAALLGISALAQAQTATSIALALSNSTVNSGTEVTLTATVSGISAAAPGTVLFCDANYMISVPTPGGTATSCEDIHIVGQAQVVTNTSSGLTVGNAYYRYFPGVGSRSYKAVFVGTTNYQPSTSAAASLTVTATASAVATTPSALTVTGTAPTYTFTSTVSGPYANAGAVTGTVNFLNTSNTYTPTASNIVASATLTAPTAFTPSFPVFGSPSASLTTTGTGPTASVVADFNNDGIPDLAVTDYTSQTVQVFFGNGSGGFTSSASYAVGVSTTHPYGVVAGDFNGDGFLDLAVTDYAGAGYISILLNKGNGTFNTAVNYSAGPSTSKQYNPYYLAIADFNGDGNLDLAVTLYGAGNSTDPGYVNIFLGNGSGVFTYSNSYATGWEPIGLAVGDFNHDGYPDLVVTCAFATNTAGSGYGTISELLNVGTSNPGTFGTQTQLSTVISTTGAAVVQRAITVGDFNGDGYTDVAVLTYQNSTSFNGGLIFLNGGISNPGLSTFTNNGSSGNDYGYSITGYPYIVYTADINGDGIADLVYDSYSGGVAYNLGTGTGAFSAYTNSLPWTTIKNESQGFSIGDFNGDGIPDVLVAFNANATGGTSNSGNIVDGFLGTWTGASTATATTTVAGTGNVTGGILHAAIEASYLGDAHFASSTGATNTSDTTTTVPTEITLAASPSGGATSSQPITLTATLNPYTTQGYKTDGDIVTFKDTTTSKTLGTGTLSLGVATLNLSAGTLSGSTNNLTAAFVDTIHNSGNTTPIFVASTSTGLNYPIGTAPTIVFTIPNHSSIDAPFTVSATSNSTGAFTYSLVSGPATVSSAGLVTLSGATGTVSVLATQAASSPYVAGTQTASFTVSSAGSVWVGNSASSLSSYSLSGSALSGSGFTGGGLGTLSGPLGIAFDSSSNAWVASSAGVSEFTSSGSAVSSSAFTVGGISSPASVAVDGNGYVWVANGNNSVSVLTNSGTAVSPSTGYTNGSMSTPVAIGIDISGNVWVLNQGNNSITQIVGGAAPVAPLAISLTNKTTGARP